MGILGKFFLAGSWQRKNSTSGNKKYQKKQLQHKGASCPGLVAMQMKAILKRKTNCASC
jgi:hypothetical protein